MDIRFSTKRLPPQRYTISRLLQIAAESQSSFDLSKFTYDAARAGVIPQLGDIAMPVRQPSGQRAPRWSSESFEPALGMALVDGSGAQQPSLEDEQQQNLAPEEPQRQPAGPPVINKAQKDAGFAQFLKKHSSPTHNRVTAGGRIVPMEKRDSPPKFNLNQSQQLVQGFRRTSKDEYQISNGIPRSPPGNEEDAADYINTQLSSTGAGNGNANVSASNLESADNAHKGNTMSPNGSSMSKLKSSTVFEPSYGSSKMPFGLNLPVLPQPILPGLVPFAPIGWQFPALSSAPSLSQEVFDGVEPTTRLLVSSQNCLAQAEMHFSNLDRQLKAIDRHRAMSHHDPNLAAQRYAIVEKRSEAKELVTRLVAQVEALQSLKGPLLDTFTRSGLVASAQPFVPQTTVISPASSRPPTADGSVDLSIDADHSFADKQPLFSKRKIIPIVAPPTCPLRPKHHKLPGGADLTSSDALGRASLGHRIPTVSDAASQGTVRYRIPSRFNGHVELLAETKVVTTTACVQSSTDSESPQIIRWADGKPGPLPAGLEAWTESYYDALRLPEGVITVFLLDEDVCFEVRGARFQRPSSARMTQAEHAYWDNKPTLTAVILNELRSKAEIINDSDYGDEYLLGRTMTRAVDRHDNMDDGRSMHSDEGGVRLQLQAAVNVQDILEEAIKVEAGRRRQAASAPQPVAPETSNDENNLGSETELSNKGYTSVSVQNINATVRLPPTFDGTTENKARNAKAVLTAANRNRSPRVRHRSSPQGGA